MALLDSVREAIGRPADIAVDGSVQKKLEKARARHNSLKPGWAECIAFWQGRQFVYRDATSNRVAELETREWGAKPRYRARTVRNRILGYVTSEVSMATQRIPQYDVTPSTTEPEDINAARLGERVLQYLHDTLNIRARMVEAYTYAVVCGEGFLRPWWNAKAGDPLPPDPNDPEGPQLYTGALCLEALGPDEVYWQPGVRFEKSSFLAIDKAMPIDDVKLLPGFNGTELRPDAQGHGSFIDGQMNRSTTKADMVIVTEYLERPTASNTLGRRLMIANNKVITPPEPYPAGLRGPDGVLPCILKVAYFPTPDRDRDMGLVEHLVDPQRTLNDAINKAIEWKNLALAPQWVTGPAGLRDQRTNEPGAIFRARGAADDVKMMPVPPIPDSLFRMADQAIADMEEISSQRGVPSGIEAGKAISVLLERDNLRRQFIVQALADVYGDLGKTLLWFVQQYFTEPQLLAIQGGLMGLDFIPDFKGADLRDQLDVNVQPGSIEARTRESMEQKILTYAQLGWIDKPEGLAAMDSGTLEALNLNYEMNQAKQQREIHQMIGLGDPRLPGGQVPIAKPFDDHKVHLGVLHTWMLSESFESSPPQVQEAAELHAEQHEQLMAEADAQALAAQNAQAESLGAANAAKPSIKPMPSLPAIGN
jgi:hypothetical protein